MATKRKPRTSAPRAVSKPRVESIPPVESIEEPTIPLETLIREARDREIAVLRDNPWFDGAWYLRENDDLAAKRVDPVSHYVWEGWREDRNPGPHFDVRWYLSTYADVDASDLNPLMHFLEHGQAEGRIANPNGTEPTIAPPPPEPAAVDAVEDLPEREHEDVTLVRSHPLFDAVWYLERYPDVAAAQADAASHFTFNGGYEGRDPGPAFSCYGYLDANTDVEEVGLNPFIHFLRYGEAEGRTR